jgi:hypothetical protein
MDQFKDLITFAVLGSVSLALTIDLCKSRALIDIICKYVFSLLSIGFLGSAALMLTDLPSYLSNVLSLDLLFMVSVVFSLGLIAHDLINRSFNYLGNTFNKQRNNTWLT